MNLKRILKLFKNDRTPTALQLSMALGKSKIDYKAITQFRYDLTQLGYRLMQFTVEKPPAAKGREFYSSTIIKYRLYKFRRDDEWPCGYKKGEIKHCWHWQSCCNGSVNRGAQRCGMAEAEEARVFNKAITKI